MSNSQARPVKTESRPPDGSAEEVADGVLRIMLPVDLPGLGHVNCYVLEDDRGLTLIDPGIADGVSHRVLTERLAAVGLDVRRAHTAVVTHSHFDHFGGVARLRAIDTIVPVETVGHRSFGDGWRTAYESIVQSEDSGSLEPRTDDEVSAITGHLVRDTPWGTPTEPFPVDLLRTWSEGLAIFDVFRPPVISQPLDDGDFLSMGGRVWTALHTPGHADDHLCFWNADLGVLFGGDHLLPTITPHISGISTYDDPLQEFFDSLERVGQLEGATIVLPAHGDPFTDLSGRASDIAEHHGLRLDRVREIGQEIGPATVEGYMQMLFRERSWGSMAMSETYAHLEWLRLHDGASRVETFGLTYKI
jgi:glyoxylase-like metal-dependent hydrolase (beta-lactamase superfamily II)